MKKVLILIAIISLFNGTVQAENGCVKDVLGTLVCSPPQGTITKDVLGTLVCGKGWCMKDVLGNIMCSNEDGGFIQKDVLGNLVCTGGKCVNASASMCKKME